MMNNAPLITPVNNNIFNTGSAESLLQGKGGSNHPCRPDDEGGRASRDELLTEQSGQLAKGRTGVVLDRITAPSPGNSE